MNDYSLFVDLLEQSAFGVTLIDSSGSVVFANNAAVRALRLSPAIVEGKKAYGGRSAIIPVNVDGTDMRREDTPAYRSVVNGERVSYELLGVRPVTGGDIVWLRVSAEPYYYQGKRMVFMTFVDVTVETTIEERHRIIDARSRLLLNQEVRFIQNASHELRTPLALIIGHLELLKDVDCLTDNQNTSLDVARRRANHLRDILDRMLAIGESRHGLYGDFVESVRDKFSLVDLADVVTEVVFDFTELAADSFVSLSIGEIEGDVIIYGHRTLIVQSVDNVVMNAIKFTAPTKGDVVVSLVIRNSMAVITVRDTGIGIDKEHVGRIFDLFYQVDGSIDRKFSGNGLGLTVVKQVVDLHNGRIEVESDVGKGSTFILSFPLFRREKER